MIGVPGPWGSWQPPRQDQEQLQLEKMQLQHNPTGRMSSRALPSEVIWRDEAHRGVNLQGATLVRQKFGRGPNTLASQLSRGRNFLWIASSGRVLRRCFRYAFAVCVLASAGLTLTLNPFAQFCGSVFRQSVDDELPGSSSFNYFISRIKEQNRLVCLDTRMPYE